MRKLGGFKASLFAASALLLATPAVAQPGDHHGDIAQEQAGQEEHAHDEQPATPRDPNAIQGSIAEPSSARTEHRVQLEAGKRYVITVETGSFDAVARLLRAGSTEPLAEDDDSGGGENGNTPRIVYTPTQSGEYVVEVRSFAPSGHGEYALSVTAQDALPALITRPTRTVRSNWQEFSGGIGADSPKDRDRAYQDYELRLTAGQTAMLHVIATQGVDTMLQVFKADERGLTPLAENDDTDGINPFLFFAPEEAGTYVVRVIGFDNEASGTYRLRISR